MAVAKLALDVPVDTLFDYLAPDVGPEDVGRLAIVPFGRRQLAGVIVGLARKAEAPAATLKTVSRIVRELPPLPADILALARFCADYYHYPLGQVLATLLPQRLRRTQPVAGLEEPVWRLTALGAAAEVTDLPKRAAVQRRLFAALKAEGRLSLSAARRLSPRAAEALRALMALGWVEESREPLAGPAAPAEHRAEPGPPLNAEQQAAVAAVRAQASHFAPWLLFGVTGSGKTEVYMQLIHDTLERHRQALVLVPEINLTPQTEARVRARFPHTPMVSLHSNLSEGERFDHWLRALRGEVGIVLGTRLSVFTPMPRLGLIVVDEEHDASFKQQDGMRYSARDVAVFRARQRDVPVVLGSATPALETWYNALKGRYHLLQLKNRAVESAQPPAVHLVNLEGQRPTEGLSASLVTALRQRVKRGEQGLVFINRRGFAPVLRCGACGWLASCTRCASRLVVHLRQGRLRCHHCGHEAPIPRHCPQCGALDLHPVGQGTQRIEQALARLVPQARVLRIDRDSVQRKNALAEALAKVHAHEVDILVGTQMLAKGHDFPKLTLVGVIDADAGLYSADFRASERLFAQLLQVAGRAGRAQHAGEVLIQTSFPDHPLFAALAAGDYAAFAHTLVAERARLGLPPFVFQALLRAEATRLATALDFLREAAAQAPAVSQVRVFDPVPALLSRLKGRERAQLLVESRSRAALQRFLAAWMPLLRSRRSRRVRWALDVDPLEI